MTTAGSDARRSLMQRYSSVLPRLLENVGCGITASNSFFLPAARLFSRKDWNK